MRYDIVTVGGGLGGSALAKTTVEIGDVPDARRMRALPLIAVDPTRIPDVPFSGPEMPADDTVRRRFFSEE